MLTGNFAWMSKSENRQMTKLVAFRTTEDHYKQLQERTREYNRKLPAYIRWCLETEPPNVTVYMKLIPDLRKAVLALSTEVLNT